MLTSLIKFFTFAPDNVSKEVYWALGVIYLFLIIATMLSIQKNIRNLATKLAWMLLITVVPVIGIAVYCIRCLALADFSFLKQFRPPPLHTQKNWI